MRRTAGVDRGSLFPYSYSIINSFAESLFAIFRILGSARLRSEPASIGKTVDMVTCVDPDPASLAYARRHAQASDPFVAGRAERVPFADRSSDHTACITARCFVAAPRHALREMVRVTRRRPVPGLLSHVRLLYSAVLRAVPSGVQRRLTARSGRRVRDARSAAVARARGH